jgi:hypothetical protein
MLAQTDPTDHALATIASILEHAEPHREPDKAPTPSTEKVATGKPSIESCPPLVPPDVDGYSKVSPGPIAAIRFKWTVRRADNGEYFVDEIVGEHSGRATSGPMAKEAAVKLVDDREAEARQRFEQLRGEMTGRVAVAGFLRGGEA